MITLGLSQITVGTAAENGTMPGNMTKIGKTYKNTCKINQEKAEVKEHYEEGMAAPEVRRKSKKIPVLVFSLMNADPQMLADYIGGTVTDGKWGYDGTEVVANKAIHVESEMGMVFDIPNADIEAVINHDASAEGIFLVDFTVTPCAVTSGKPFNAAPKTTLTVSPTSLSFTNAADATGKTVTASSTGNVTSAHVAEGCDWVTAVTYSGKVVTVKVAANPNTDARSTALTMVADGKTQTVPITQAGA